MFGASVSELYLLIKSLINIGRGVDLCVIKKNNKTHSVHRNCESSLAIIQVCYTQTGPAHAAGRGGGIDRRRHSSYLLLHVHALYR